MFWEDIETYIILPLSNKHAEIMIQENIICESIPKFSIGLKHNYNLEPIVKDETKPSFIASIMISY